MNVHAPALAQAHAFDEQASVFAGDVIGALSQHPKKLSPKYFYDAAGSELFEQITVLPEYYPTRTELGILRGRGREIADIIPNGAALVEFGAGATTKVRLLLESCDFAAYVPVDISGDFLSAQAEALRKDFPAKNLQEFIAYAKKNPGKINLGHAGIGSSNFLICKSFEQAAGIEITLVGYRGAAPALTDAIGGQIDGVCDSAASVSQAIDDKLVKGLVVGSTVRLSTLSDLPTSAEAGLPEFEAQGWNGLFAPKGTPPAVIAKLNVAAKAAVESEAVKKRFVDLSTVAPDANEMAPDVLGQLVTRDVAKYKKLLEEKK